MTTAVERLHFTPILKAGGDVLWLAKAANNADLYAVSDGTHPLNCDHGPYMIDQNVLAEDGFLNLSTSHGRTGHAVGNFFYRLHGELCRVNTALGVALELAKRCGIKKYKMMIPYSSGGQDQVLTLTGDIPGSGELDIAIEALKDVASNLGSGGTGHNSDAYPLRVRASEALAKLRERGIDTGTD